MHHFNYTPMLVLSNTMYELYVGFSSTHPKADEWQATRRKLMRENLGESVETLIDYITHQRIAAESATDDAVMCEDEFKALDQLAVHAGARPAGWVPAGGSHGLLRAPNLPTLLLWLRAGIEEFNLGGEAVSAPSIDAMMVELQQTLPRFGSTDHHWMLKFEPDPETWDETHAGFVTSNIGDPVFCYDARGDRVPYMVNANELRFPCPLGVCTVWSA